MSKGLASSIKTAGEIKEAYGKLKDNKALQSFVTTLSAIPLPAKLAAAGIAAVGVAGKVAYDTWYNSQYRWSEGLSEGNSQIQKSLNSYKQLTDVQGQIKSLKLIIDNPDSSKEQVDDAKSKIEEIKQLLSKEYNIIIKSDNSNLEDTVENIKTVTSNELQSNINSQQEKLRSLQPKVKEYKERKQALEEESAAALEAQTRYSGLLLKLQTLDKNSANYAQTVRDLGVEYGVLKEWQRNIADPTNVGIYAQTGYDKATEDLNKYNKQLNDLNGSYDELAVSEELANWETELIKIAAANKDTMKFLIQMKINVTVI